MNELNIVVGDRVTGTHPSGKIRGRVRMVNGNNVHIDAGDGRVLHLTTAQITQVNGKKING